MTTLQRSLCFPAPPGSSARPSRAPRSDPHAARNRETAALILADLERYGGEGSLMVRWARAVAERGAECQRR
jgi:hypothetical protein